MPLKKLLLKPGVNKENTRYTTEGGWYDTDKVRFRQGTPEKIGGWQRLSVNTFLGVCRSLWSWVTLSSQNLIGVGTNLKFYISRGGLYNDVTPFRAQVTLTNPFSTVAGSPIVEVDDVNSGYVDGDFVTFYGGTSVGGLNIVGTFQITISTVDAYTIDVGTPAASTATGGGTVYALYQINVGAVFVIPVSGWGAGTWGAGTWGFGGSSLTQIRLWSQSNFGEDLVFGPKGGGIYYWDASHGLTGLPASATVATPTVVTSSTTYTDGTPVRFAPDAGATLPTGILPGKLYYVRNSAGVTFNISESPDGALVAVSGAGSGIFRTTPNAYNLADYGGAAQVPTVQNYILISDTSRFVFAFGCNDYGETVLDPLLIRWSDQEDATNWAPEATNQAGFLRLSSGSKIIKAQQSRQEILVWTDSALYSLQYVGAPIVWSSQPLGENISIASQNATAYANGVTYWMAKDKFYMYDGRVQPLNCDLRRYIFDDFNQNQYDQVCCGTNEGFNEVWWFYCSTNSTQIDRYVVYNYVENIWHHGNLGRTAWLDSGLRPQPIAATYLNNLVEHEIGSDDASTGTPTPIVAQITSSEFDLDDGHQFMFVWRVLPDITFQNSSAAEPTATMYLLPLKNSGSGYVVNPETNADHSVANQSSANITRTAVLPVEQFTGQVFTRVRGRQMAMKIESTGLGVTWQLGSPRIDMRPDGRR
jgi:hypothetical protein